MKRCKTYTDNFLAAWEAYPHSKSHPQRSSKKEAYRVWRAWYMPSGDYINLDNMHHEVMRWIVAYSSNNLGGGNEFSKGMQAWLRQTDFTEPAPRPQQQHNSICPTCTNEPCSCQPYDLPKAPDIKPGHEFYRPAEWWDRRGLARPAYLEKK